MITPWDNLRFLVPSRSGEKDYMVDLGAHDCNGSCTCKHFEVRLQPKVKLGVVKPMRCKHLLAARSYFVDCVIRHLRDEEEKTSKQGKRQKACRVEDLQEIKEAVS